jgi:hypothetical protein
MGEQPRKPGVLASLFRFDGHGGRWPGVWYSYLDWRLRRYPELEGFDADERLSILFETRRRLEGDRRVMLGRLLPLPFLLIVSFGGPPALAAVRHHHGQTAAVAIGIGGFAALVLLMRLTSNAVGVGRRFRECLSKVVAEHRGESSEASA